MPEERLFSATQSSLSLLLTGRAMLFLHEGLVFKIVRGFFYIAICCFAIL